MIAEVGTFERRMYRIGFVRSRHSSRKCSCTSSAVADASTLIQVYTHQAWDDDFALLCHRQRHGPQARILIELLLLQMAQIIGRIQSQLRRIAIFFQRAGLLVQSCTLCRAISGSSFSKWTFVFLHASLH